jgi:putative endonuclease
MKNNRETGAIGEKLAQDFLQKNGYEIIETNKHFSKFCEIDIIAKQNDTLVFVEVKTRSTDFCGSPLEAITKKKYENIKIGVFNYLKETEIKHKNFRIDAISIILKPKIQIQHLKNIYL